MLFILRGVSGSGKSSSLADLYGDAVVSSDKIRSLLYGDSSIQRFNSKVFAHVKNIVEARLSEKLLTILDSTNLNVSRISKYIEIAKYYGVPYKVISIDLPSSCYDAGKFIEKESYKEEADVLHKGTTLRTNAAVPSFVIEDQIKKFIRSEQGIIDYVGKENFIRINPKATFYIPLTINQFIRERFEVDVTNKDLWIVGDVHACHKELKKLIDKILDKSPEALIYSAGDLIDRGESMEKTFDLYEKYFAGGVVGNHEVRFLLEQQEVLPCNSKARAVSHNEFRTWPRDKADRFLKFINTAPLFLKFLDKRHRDKVVLLSHGGISSSAIKESHVYGQFSSSFGPEDRSGNLEKSLIDGKEAIQVHGHASWEFKSIEDSVDDPNRIINIDSGCVYGGKLTAFNPFTKEYIQVDSEYDYIKNTTHFHKYGSTKQFKDIVHYLKSINSKDPLRDTFSFTGFTKLHGTNASIVQKSTGEIYAQSKERILYPGKATDNCGFARYVSEGIDKKDLEEFFNTLALLCPDDAGKYDIIAYGEWVGKGVKKGDAISNLDGKKFFLFSVKFASPTNDARFFTLNAKDLMECEYEIPLFDNVWKYGAVNLEVDLNNLSKFSKEAESLIEIVEKQCPIGKHLGLEGSGEGFVFHSDDKSLVDQSGNPIKFKIKSKAHSDTDSKVAVPVDQEKLDSIEAFANYAVTDVRCSKGIDYMNEMGHKVSFENIAHYLKWMGNDILKEESGALEANGLEWKEVQKACTEKYRRYFVQEVKKSAP